jgi:inorganic pyrophosphatase-like protein
VRRGKDPKWGPWETKMLVPYGYIRGTKGMDGNEVDCFVGEDVNARQAYVITIRKQPDFKKDDEQKVMLGFPTAKAAKACFLKHYNDSRFFGKMETIPMEQFKKKVMQKPGRIEADNGEPNSYPGGYAHIEPTPTYHAPSNKHAKRVPVDSPMETDDSFGDVTKRKEKATKAFRDRLTKQHTDANWRPLSSTQVSGFPSGTVGGFG